MNTGTTHRLAQSLLRRELFPMGTHIAYMGLHDTLTNGRRRTNEKIKKKTQSRQKDNQKNAEKLHQERLRTNHDIRRREKEKIHCSHPTTKKTDLNGSCHGILGQERKKGIEGQRRGNSIHRKKLEMRIFPPMHHNVHDGAQECQ